MTPCGGHRSTRRPASPPDPFPIHHAGRHAPPATPSSPPTTCPWTTSSSPPLPARDHRRHGHARPTRTITVTVDGTVPVGEADLALTLVDGDGATTSVAGTVDGRRARPRPSPRSRGRGDQPASAPASPSRASSPRVHHDGRPQRVLRAGGGRRHRRRRDDVRGHLRRLRRRCPAGLAAGDLVDVAGVAAEDFAMTQIDDASTAGRRVVSTGNALPPADDDRPAGRRPTDAAATFESVEGMVTTFTDDADGDRVLRAGPVRPAGADRRRPAVPVHPRRRPRASPATRRTSPSRRPAGSSSTTTTTTRTTPSATGPTSRTRTPRPGCRRRTACAAATRSRS